MNEQLDHLDRLLWGGSEPISSRQAPEEKEVWMSPEEFAWREINKQLDEHRRRNGLRPISAEQREKTLRAYLDSLHRNNEYDYQLNGEEDERNQ